MSRLSLPRARLLLIVAVLLCAGPSRAADILVNAGTRAVVGSAPTEITEATTQNPRARSAVVKDGAVWDVIYTPDPGTPEYTDVVAWVAEGKPVMQTVRVGAVGGGDPYGAGAKALFALFAIAVVLESGLALIFTWRPFLDTFNSHAVKPLVSFVVALGFVRSFGLDLVTDLVAAFLPARPGPGALGYVMTALVVAGGSSGVNRLMQALGVRPARADEVKALRPSPTKAWLSVRARRKSAVGDITVLVTTTTAAGKVESVLGILTGKGAAGWLRRFFLFDHGRAPPQGGHELLPGPISVRLVDETGKQGPQTWGEYSLAAGSVIDLELEF